VFKNYRDKRILILGFGVEGKSTYDLLRKEFPDKVIGIADKTNIDSLDTETKDKIKKDSFLKINFGDQYLDSLKDYEVIFKTPGIALDTKELLEAKKAGVEITSQAKLFFEIVNKKQVIGITGTKGKSTTSSLLYDILKKENEHVYLVGNIGNPPLEALGLSKKESLFVYEMSSYQLEDLTASPHIAIFLNLYEDHLDYHKSKENYRKAKENIFRHQGEDDYLIIQDNFAFLANQGVKSSIYTYSLSSKTVQFGAYLEDDFICYAAGDKGEKVIKTDDISLKGTFNKGNSMAAIIAAKIKGVANKSIVLALKDFKPLPHRIEFVSSVNGVSFYDDSISTIPQATLGAIEALGGEVETLIMGGYDRNIDFNILADGIANSSVKNIILFPGSGSRIWDAISGGKANDLNHYFVTDMSEAVNIAIDQTSPGKICLLSPASPSFGLYKDYKARGNAFKNEVMSHLG
jgi:UDP-N-acetylmuramoyl-L-alanine---L-glutamate ligase